MASRWRASTGAGSGATGLRLADRSRTAAGFTPRTWARRVPSPPCGPAAGATVVMASLAAVAAPRRSGARAGGTRPGRAGQRRPSPAGSAGPPGRCRRSPGPNQSRGPGEPRAARRRRWRHRAARPGRRRRRPRLPRRWERDGRRPGVRTAVHTRPRPRGPDGCHQQRPVTRAGTQPARSSARAAAQPKRA